MTRIVDKRNVCIVAVGNADADAAIQLYKRGTLAGVVSGKYENKIEISSASSSPVESLTTPDMIAVVNTSYPSGNASVTAKFNGVAVPATEVYIGGDTYKLWGFKPQDFVLFDFSGATA